MILGVFIFIRLIFESTSASPSPTTQPLTVVCKMEGQLEHIHVAHTSLHVSVLTLHAQSMLINKASASELGRKLVRSALLVG